MVRLFGKLDYRLKCYSRCCSCGVCLSSALGAERILLGASHDIHMAFLGTTWRVTATPWLVSVHAGVKNPLSCVCTAVKEYFQSHAIPASLQPTREKKQRRVLSQGPHVFSVL